jgi:hypothetical protein
MGRRFADVDGYRSKEPMIVSNAPLSHSSFVAFVSYVGSFGASVLFIFAPNGLQQAP